MNGLDNVTITWFPDDADCFLNEEMEDVAPFLGRLLNGLVEDDDIQLVCGQDRQGLTFRIKFSNSENNKLFVGPQFRVVNAVLEILRFQQHLKHRRYITFELVQADGSIQKICNRRVFSKSSNGIERVQAMFQKGLNAGSASTRVLILKQVRTAIDNLLEKKNG